MRNIENRLQNRSHISIPIGDLYAISLDKILKKKQHLSWQLFEMSQCSNDIIVIVKEQLEWCLVIMHPNIYKEIVYMTMTNIENWLQNRSHISIHTGDYYVI